MVVYRLSTNYIFLSQVNETTVSIYEYYSITNAVVSRSHYKRLCEVGKQKEYDALEIFGTEIRGDALERLARVLHNSYVDVNREGLCYLFIKDVGISQTFGSIAYRLNDIFDWSVYGVKSQVTTAWDRRGLPSDVTIVDYEDKKRSLEKLQNDFQEKEKEVKDLKNQLSNCNKQLHTKEEELTGLQRKLLVVEAEMKSTRDELKFSREMVAQSFAELNYNNKQLLPKLLFVSCIAGVLVSMLLSLFLTKKT